GALVVGEGLSDDLRGEIAGEGSHLAAQLRRGGYPLGAQLLASCGEQALVLRLRTGTGLVDDLLAVGARLLADRSGFLTRRRELLLLVVPELVSLLLDLLRMADAA